MEAYFRVQQPTRLCWGEREWVNERRGRAGKYVVPGMKQRGEEKKEKWGNKTNWVRMDWWLDGCVCQCFMFQLFLVCGRLWHAPRGDDEWDTTCLSGLFGVAALSLLLVHCRMQAHIQRFFLIKSVIEIITFHYYRQSFSRVFTLPTLIRVFVHSEAAYFCHTRAICHFSLCRECESELILIKNRFLMIFPPLKWASAERWRAHTTHCSSPTCFHFHTLKIDFWYRKFLSRSRDNSAHRRGPPCSDVRRGERWYGVEREDFSAIKRIHLSY